MANPTLKPNDRVSIPFMQHPLFRTEFAIQRGVERNLLFRTWGGLGDQICAEPTLRYALKMFRDVDISLASEQPELFRHLKFKKVFDLREEVPNYDRFFVFDTITPPDDSNLVWCFMSHMLTNCVDFPSLCALRLQLPVADREIKLEPELPKNCSEIYELLHKAVVIHPGKHWQSKTFPEWFWNDVITHILKHGIKPIIIGHDMDDNRGTVNVNTTGCLDLRNKMSVNDTCWMLKHARVLLTNDSSPLHMAAAGKAWVGCVATVKHPDMIGHWRNGQWMWQEKFFNKGGIWDLVDFCPNKKEKLEAEYVEPEVLESWLPNPKDFAMWGVEKWK